MAYLAAGSIKFPPNYYPQDFLAKQFTALSPRHAAEHTRINFIWRNTGIKGRYLAATVEELKALNGFGKANDKWIECALDLSEACVQELCQKSGLEPADIGQVTFASSTGFSIPSIEARLVNRLPFSPRLKRTPMYGLGCAAGAAGLGRVADYLQGHPSEAAIFISVELCSLTIQTDDLSLANVIAAGLFADGAGAMLLVGNRHPLAQAGLPRIVDNRSVLVPNTERSLGFDVVDSGLKIVLDAKLADLARQALPGEIQAFLARNELAVADIAHWFVHPGGPKIIEGVREGLNLSPEAVGASYETLQQVGNISSVSVLHMLNNFMAAGQGEKGQYGMVIGLGPGFGAEMVLLKW